MNVTSKGYFSEDYLHKVSPRNQHSDRYYDQITEIEDEELDVFGMDNLHGNYSGGYPGYMRRPDTEYLYDRRMQESSSRKSEYSKAPSGRRNEESGSARSPNTSARSPTPSRTPITSSKTPITSTQSSPREPSISYFESNRDPDYLHHEITPAELIQHQPAPYRASRHDPYAIRGQRGVRRAAPPQQAPKPKYDDYYIKQKKRHDESPFKPKLYTHKTFMDVFHDKGEDSGKYNPMEFVFEEDDEKNNLKKVFKSLQNKMGREDYSNYDYYKNKPKKEALQEVFVAPVSDDDDENEDGENYYYEGEDVEKKDGEKKEGEKKQKDLKKVWKKKMKRAKKELGRNFFANADKQHEIHANSKKAKGKKAELGPVPVPETETEFHENHKEDSEIEEFVRDPEVLPVESFSSEEEIHRINENRNFHPAWDYMLSWLVYKGTQDEPIMEPRIEPIPEERKKSKSVFFSHDTSRSGPKPSKSLANQPQRFNLKSLKKNYGLVMSKWNDPMVTLFNENEPSSRSLAVSKRSRMTKISLPGSTYDGNDTFEIEIDDDDESEIRQVLYMNPITKQLEDSPPTSFNSLDPDVQSIDSSSYNIFHSADHGPVAIISNINNLIKNFKIMRIIFAPIDVIADSFPNLQTIVILIELVIFMWILYELSLLIDALCMMVKAVCAPMITMGRFMNRIM